MDDYENNNDIFDDSDSDSLFDSDDIGLEEVRDSGTEETETDREDISDSPDYSSILTDIHSDIQGIYEFITIETDPEEITLSDIHNDLRIVSCLILLFIGFYVMRSIVYKFTRRF